MSPERKVNEANRSNVTFDEYIDDFAQIYLKTDAKRDVTDVLLNLVMHTSRVSEAVRRNQSAAILERLSEVVAWLLSLVAKRRAAKDHPTDKVFYSPIPMTEIIWEKYPAQCPTCIEREVTREELEKLGGSGSTDESFRPILSRLNEVFKPGIPKQCICLSSAGVEDRNQKDSENTQRLKRLIRREYARNNRASMKRTVGEIEDMFRAIYEVNVANHNIADVVFHLQEEVGEVAEALLRTYTYDRVKDKGFETHALYEERLTSVDEELADVFSWVYSLIFKIQETGEKADEWWEMTIGELANRMLSWRDISLPAVIWLKYGDKPRGRGQGPSERFLGCGDCGQHECTCDYLIARKAELVNALIAWE
jgi:NTP pyrophosphatase (non-canonical NTP hydrolase)